MKFRTDFVTNSSSSSFVLVVRIGLKNGKVLKFKGESGVGEYGEPYYEMVANTSPEELGRSQSIQELIDKLRNSIIEDGICKNNPRPVLTEKHSIIRELKKLSSMDEIEKITINGEEYGRNESQYKYYTYYRDMGVMFADEGGDEEVYAEGRGGAIGFYNYGVRGLNFGENLGDIDCDVEPDLKDLASNQARMNQARMNQARMNQSGSSSVVAFRSVFESFDEYRAEMEAACREGKQLEEMIEAGREAGDADEYSRHAFEQAIKNLDRNAIVTFSGKHFVLTGFGAYEKEVIAEIEKRGGIVHSSMVKMADYLVVHLESPGAAKVKKALEWRQKGVYNLIVSDYQMWRAIFEKVSSGIRKPSNSAVSTTRSSKVEQLKGFEQEKLAKPIAASKPAVTKPKERKYGWIGDIIPEGADQAEIEKELEEMSDEDAQTLINAMKQLQEIQRQISDLSDMVDQAQKEDEEKARREREEVEHRGTEESVNEEKPSATAAKPAALKVEKPKSTVVKKNVEQPSDVKREYSKEEWIAEFGQYVEKDPQIEMKDKIIVFDPKTQKPSMGNRSYAEEVIDRGGVTRQNVSSKTDYLVVSPECDALTMLRKAIELKDKGNKIKIVTEEDFQAALDRTLTIAEDGTLDLNGETEIRQRAFKGNMELKTIRIPEGVTYIGDRAFQECKNLKAVILPETLTSIGVHAFDQCTALENVTFNEGLETISESAFSECTSLENVTFNEGLKEIGEWTFKGCTSLKSVTFNEGLKEIGEYAFYDCESLTSVTFNDGLETIGKSAFSGCESLTSVTFNDGLETIGESAFSGCESLRSVTFNDELKAIESSAFQGCTSLESVTFNDGLETIGECAFSGCESLRSVTFNDELKAIERSAFQGCTSLESVTFNDELKAIGLGAFGNCKSLQSVTFNKRLKEIGQEAFGNCESLQSVTFNDGLETIGESAFWGCKSLQSVTFNDGLEIIGEWAFDGCTSLTSVTFNDGLKEIGCNVFHDCGSLTSVTFNDGLETIGESAFYGCTSLESVTFNDGLETIGESAFSGCTSLESVTFNDGLKEIGESAFYRCESLQSVAFNAKLKEIGQGAFAFCESLRSVTFDGGPSKIDESIFFGCRSLQSITFNGGVEIIDRWAFDCESLQSVTFNGELEKISENAFGVRCIPVCRLPESLRGWAMKNEIEDMFLRIEYFPSDRNSAVKMQQNSAQQPWANSSVNVQTKAQAEQPIQPNLQPSKNESVSAKTVPSQKEERIKQLRSQIDTLNREYSAAKGILKIFRRRKLRKQIEQLSEELEQIEEKALFGDF